MIVNLDSGQRRGVRRRPGCRYPDHRLRPPDPRRRRHLLRVLRQRRRSASSRVTASPQCLDDAGKTKANIVYINGAPTDNNATLFKEGYASALKAKIDAGDYKLVGDQTGEWDTTSRADHVRADATPQKGARSTAPSSPTTAWPAAIVAPTQEERSQRQGPDHGPGRHGRGSAAHARRHPVHDRLQGRQARGRRGREARDRLIKGDRLRRGSRRHRRRHQTNKKVDVAAALRPVWITKDNVKDVVRRRLHHGGQGLHRRPRRHVHRGRHRHERAPVRCRARDRERRRRDACRGPAPSRARYRASDARATVLASPAPSAREDP